MTIDHRNVVEDILRRHLMLDIEDPDLDLLESGLIDSLSLVELMANIERELSLRIELEKLDLDDFRSVRSLATYLARLMTSSK